MSLTNSEKLKNLIGDSQFRQATKSIKDKGKFVELDGSGEEVIKAIKKLKSDSESVDNLVVLSDEHGKEISSLASRQDSIEQDISALNADRNNMNKALISTSLVKSYSESVEKATSLPFCINVENDNDWDEVFFELNANQLGKDGSKLCECPVNYSKDGYDSENQQDHIACVTEQSYCAYGRANELPYLHPDMGVCYLQTADY